MVLTVTPVTDIVTTPAACTAALNLALKPVGPLAPRKVLREEARAEPVEALAVPDKTLKATVRSALRLRALRRCEELMDTLEDETLAAAAATVL